MSRKNRKYKLLLQLNETARKEPRLLDFKRPKWSRLKDSTIRDYFIFIPGVTRHIPYWRRSNYNFRSFTDQIEENEKTKYEDANVKEMYRLAVKAKRKFVYFYNLDLNYKTLKKIYNSSESIYDFMMKFEHRIDIFLWRLGLAKNPSEARQLILHNKVLVNGEIVNIKSYLLKKGDFIQVDLPRKLQEARERLLRKINPRYAYRKTYSNRYMSALIPYPQYVVANYNTYEFFVVEDLNTRDEFEDLQYQYSTYLDLVSLQNYFRLH